LTTHRSIDPRSPRGRAIGHMSAVAATIMLWLAGLTLVLLSANRALFDRVVRPGVRSQYEFSQRLPSLRHGRRSEEGFVQTKRWLLLGSGALFLVLAVVSTWALIA
jgi:hypothetical protein